MDGNDTVVAGYNLVRGGL